LKENRSAGIEEHIVRLIRLRYSKTVGMRRTRFISTVKMTSS